MEWKVLGSGVNIKHKFLYINCNANSDFTLKHLVTFN